MAKKYGVASDYIKYTSRIKSDTSDGVAVEASQVVDLEEDKLQSDINKELKASIASASGNTYSKSEIDGKDTATLTSAKSYTDEKFSTLGSVYTTKGSCTAAQLKALTSAKAGDVWNITDAVTIDGKAYPAGVNVVCVTAFSAAIDPAATKNWDALQGLQDLTSYAKKSEIEDVAGKIQGVKIYRSTNGFNIQDTESYALKAIIGINVHIGDNILIGQGVNITDAIIGTNLGTDLPTIHNKGNVVAIGTGVKIANGVGIAVDESLNLIFGREVGGSYATKKAATTDDLSALATRVSALEDLLKLA